MIDEALKSYVHEELKKGYDISTIRRNLISAGHDIEKVQHSSDSAFELFHRDLLDYINSEVHQKRTLEEIKSDLLSLGHAEKKLDEVIGFHRSRRIGKSAQDDVKKHVPLLQNKRLLYIYLAVGAGTLILLLLIGFVVTYIHNSTYFDLNYDDRRDICDSIVGAEENAVLDYYHMLCISLINVNNDYCDEIYGDAEATKSCKDTYHMIRFFKMKKKSICDSINDVNAKELCYQLFNRKCNNLFGYEEECRSITLDDVKLCKDEEGTGIYPIIEGCKDNYFLYKGVRGQSIFCGNIEDKRVSKLCRAVS